jgi:hypothetical protein
MSPRPSLTGRRFAGQFVRLKPGDVVTHPRTQEPLAIVVSAKRALVQRRGKPDRHRITFTFEDIGAENER